ncbi:2360_t:CDS:10, partial [Racocetra persica]
ILNTAKMSIDVIWYIFPKQFGLYNVFDHDDNGLPSGQSLFKLYQDRTTEIKKFNDDIPPRLIQVLPMIDRMISRHKKCQYGALLNRYCPVMVQKKLFALATVNNPHTQDLNSYSNLYQITQCKWLFVEGHKKNKIEADKRTELLYEFIWWIFDCFVIPLLQNTFYITTNATYKNRVFYYRHDIWLRIEQSGIESLTEGTFEEVPKENEKQLLNKSFWGYSSMRFIPNNLKGTMRPVINLSSALKMSNGRVQKKSVNAILRDAFQALTYEKDMKLSDKDSSKLGGSVFNFNEIYERLKSFKQKLGENKSKLYFAKVDVKCCFESINQDQVLEIVKDVLKESEYAIHKYDMVCQKGGAVRARYNYYANSSDDFPDFPNFARKSAQKFPNSVFVDRVKESFLDKNDILGLLEKHIKYNLIKMEWELFPFVEHDDGVMLRFLDDSLYISTDKKKVERFITAMHKGHPKYSCVVNKEKSLTNFDIIIDGEPIEKLSNTRDFPWCGILINTSSLNCKVDYMRYSFSYIADTLTVNTSRHPGEVFRQKMIE